jgi:hypothetical protein
LIACLDSIECDNFVLISTVDVFKTPVGVDENTPIDVQDLHAYGLNRYRLEQFVAQKFSRHVIVRLPGLIGPGLRKNIIFDFLNDNNVTKIESRSVFQFYPMVNLWFDINKALENNISLVHLTAEPVSVAQIAGEGFGFEFTRQQARPPFLMICAVYMAHYLAALRITSTLRRKRCRQSDITCSRNLKKLRKISNENLHLKPCLGH